MKFIKFLLLTAIVVTIASCSTNDSVTSKKTDDGIKARATKALDDAKQAETKTVKTTPQALRLSELQKQAGKKVVDPTRNPDLKAAGATNQTIINVPDTSVQDLTAPSAENAAPSAENAAPSAENAAPSAENAAPSAENAAPSAENAAPSAENAAPSAENAAPSAENAAPSAENAAPSAENAAPSAENAAPSAENAAPSLGTTEQNSATALGTDNVGSSSSDTKNLGVKNPKHENYDSSTY